MANTFHIEMKKNKRVRGWPTPSAKPFLVYRNGTYVAAFATRIAANEYIARKDAEQ